jgi:hypothetical protein
VSGVELFSPPTNEIPTMNPSKEFQIGTILLAEKTPSSGDFISCGNLKTGQW